MKRNRLIYIIMLFLSFAFVYFYGGKVPYMLFYTTLALPFASFFYALLILARLNYSQEVSSSYVVKGDTIDYTFIVKNKDILLYPYISITFTGSETFESNRFNAKNFSLPPLAKKGFKLELLCKYRGSHEVGISSIVIRDFLGIVRLPRKAPSKKKIVVFPRIVVLDKFHFQNDSESESYFVLNGNNEDMSTIADVRKYAYGDSLKKIHWKLTAKVQDLMVKKFQNTSESNVILVLDLMRNPFSVLQNAAVEDKMIESAVSLLHYCISKWIPANLVYYTNEIISIKADNPLTFENAYRLLADVNFSESIAVKDLLDIYLSKICLRGNVVVFTTRVGYELYNQICKTSSLGYDISLIYISPETVTGFKNPEAENIMAFLPEIGVKSYTINMDDEITSVLEVK